MLNFAFRVNKGLTGFRFAQKSQRLIRVLDTETGNYNVKQRNEENHNKYDVVQYDGCHMIPLFVNVQTSNNHKHDRDD